MDMLEFGRKVLAQQSFSVLLGTELTAYSEGQVEMTLPLREDLRQQYGYAHGGVLAYLADNALTYAGGSVLQDVVTGEIKINYIRPGVGDALVARAHVVSHGRSQAVCRCDIYARSGDAEKLCAAAQGTIISRRASSSR